MHRITHRLSLNSLRVQVFLWTVLPLTILLIIFSLSGISSHQQSMRALAIEENTRLVATMAEIVALQRENYAHQVTIPIAQIRVDQLDLDSFLTIDTENAIDTILLINSDQEILWARGYVPSIDELGNWPGIDAIQSGERGVQFTANHMQGDIIAYTPVRDSDWVLVIREPWHSLTDPVIRFEQVMPAVLFIAVTISIFTLLFGIRSVAQPLVELGQRANEIGQGNFNAASQPVGGVEEIEDMRLALNSMAQRVHNYQTALQDYLGAVTHAQEEERARIARDLHDETTQTLIALGHKAQMAQRSLTREPAETAQIVSDLRKMIAQSIEEVRRFSRALHPHYLEELGLISALEALAREADATFTLSGTPRRMNAEKELAIFRIAQEALNNALKHANAYERHVSLNFTAEQVSLVIQDDGDGFEFPTELNALTRTGHFGLIGIRERAQLIGATLQIASELGQGTKIQLTVTDNVD